MRLRRLVTGVLVAVIGCSTLMTVAVTPLVGATGNDCTWTGASSDQFSVAANWTGCNGTAPQNGDNLTFDITNLTSSLTLDNDMTGLSIGTLTFQGTYDANYDSITLTGNELSVANIVSSGDAYANLGMNLKLTADMAITTGIYLDNTSGNQTIDLNGHNLTIGGGVQQWLNQITGTGNVIVNSYAVFGQANTGWSGSLQVNSGGSAEMLNTASLNQQMAVTVNSGGYMSLCTFNGAKVAASLAVSGDGDGNGAVRDEKACEMGGPGIPNSLANVNWSGPVVLTGNTVVGGFGNFTISGPLSGNYSLKQKSGTVGQLTIASSANTSGTANGVMTSPTLTTNYGSNDPTQFLDIEGNNIALVDGNYGDVQVAAQGILKGYGSLGAVNVDQGGIIAPGHSPGCLTTHDLTLAGTYQAELGGTQPCTGYDQLKVNGTVTLSGATLDTVLYKGYEPKSGSSYTIINNDGKEAVLGTFTGLKEGATFNLAGYVFRISYKGGDGNDVVLSVLNTPGTPDTGFAVTSGRPLLTLGVLVIVAGGLVLIARKVQRPVQPKR